MKFNDSYFLNTFHKARFQDVARRNGRIYQETKWLVAAYLFTSTPSMTEKTAACLMTDSIDFDKLAEDSHFTEEEKILIAFAANYFAPEDYQGPTVSQLIHNLSGENYAVIINIFKMFI